MSEQQSDVKQLLVNLGNRLVERHGFRPAFGTKPHREKTTDEILRFLAWLDGTPEAREELEKMGFSFMRTVPTPTFQKVGRSG